jgi:hypothetical protein
MVIEYSVGDTAPAVEIEIDNYALQSSNAEVFLSVGMTAANKEFELIVTSETEAVGNPPLLFFDEVGKFPAEVRIETGGGTVIETFRGFYVRVYESLA